MGALDFEWDPAKAASNERKHDVRFGAAIEVFLDGHRLDADATRKGDGEDRRKVVGVIDGRLLTLVYSRRGQVVRVISARPSNAQEARRYGYR
ncbi:BrnT family toxin [Phenylobacterium sp.]|uniref:BrnT family toxin n=1 Tax=Phenylobacterium sp. TaxID=1871053 RepID=UPI0038620A8D